MNFRMIRSILFKLLMAEGLLMLLPMAVSLYYRESVWTLFLILAAVLVLVGWIFGFHFRPTNTQIYAKEGFFIVGIAWILWSAFGALVFVFSGVLPNPVDAWFEMVSGFTTTGSSVLTAVEWVPKGVLFWRSFSHWIGGMGVLVFVLAVIPLAQNRSMYLMGAEVPGPVASKLVPKTGSTAKILYMIYLGMTVLLIILLCCGGMPLFDSVCHAFGTAGTGGFSIRNASIAAYASPYCEVVITVFMILFGINFNIFYLLLLRRFRNAVRSEEMWTYLGIIAASVSVIAVNTVHLYESAAAAVRGSAFTVASIISTTGYVTADFDKWPFFSQTILLLLMVLGACAGSTGGGIKAARTVIIAKSMKREMKKMVHPRMVSLIHIDGRRVEDNAVRGVQVYMLFYGVITFLSVLLVSLNGFDITTTVSSVFACLNNIGPGLGHVVGATGNYASLSILSKIVLSLDMLLGRLEIFPILLLLMPIMWKKRGIS